MKAYSDRSGFGFPSHAWCRLHGTLPKSLALLLVVWAACTGSLALAQTPISWWAGDGNAIDSISGNNGVLNGGVSYAFGNVDQAFSFNGTDGVVLIPDVNNLKITGSLSIAATIKITALSTNGLDSKLVFRGDDRFGFDPYWIAVSPDGRLVWHIATSTDVLSEISAPIAIGRFVSIVASLNDATGEMRLYLDGQLVASGTTTLRPFRDLDPTLHPAVAIGNTASPSLHPEPFNGLIDDVKIYNTVVTPSPLILNAANGHYYELVTPNTLPTWLDAKAAAQNRTYLGLRGHLLTINSANEQQFIATNMPAAITFESWLGGYQDTTAPDYSEPTGGWRWITGEPFNFTNWRTGEPNDAFNTENSLQISTNGFWNDVTGTLQYPFVVEYESYPYLFHYDFDGDGKADLVFQNQSTNQVALWNLNGLTVNGGTLVTAAPSAGYQVVGTADFNGDGKPDLLFQNATAGQLVLWYMNGAVRTGGDTLSAKPDAAYKVVGIGDFNGDGKMDIVFQSQTTNQIAIWFLNGTKVTGGVAVPTVPIAGYKVVGVGDFNGDGQLDLLFQNQTSGTMTAWFFNGTTFVGGLGITASAGAGWKVKSVADFNGDGHPDLMFQNATTGQAVLWYMNGVNFLSGGALSYTPAANYQIVGPH